MTTKEYLWQSSAMERRIRILKKEIEKMRSLSISISVKCDGERVQSSGSYDPMADAVAKIMDREAYLSEMINQYLLKKEILESQLGAMDNSLYSDVLYGRCIVNLSFYDLGYQIGKKRRQTINIYNKAVAAFEEQFYEFYKDDESIEKSFLNQ